MERAVEFQWPRPLDSPAGRTTISPLKVRRAYLEGQKMFAVFCQDIRCSRYSCRSLLVRTWHSADTNPIHLQNLRHCGVVAGYQCYFLGTLVFQRVALQQCERSVWMDHNQLLTSKLQESTIYLQVFHRLCPNVLNAFRNTYSIPPAVSSHLDSTNLLARGSNSYRFTSGQK